MYLACVVFAVLNRSFLDNKMLTLKGIYIFGEKKCAQSQPINFYITKHN